MAWAGVMGQGTVLLGAVGAEHPHAMCCAMTRAEQVLSPTLSAGKCKGNQGIGEIFLIDPLLWLPSLFQCPHQALPEHCQQTLPICLPEYLT